MHTLEVSDELQDAIYHPTVQQVTNQARPLLKLLFEHYTQRGSEPLSFTRLWQALQDFTLAPAVVTRPRLLEILRVMCVNEDTEAGPADTAEPLCKAAGLTLQELCEVVVRCAAIFCDSTDPARVAETLGQLVQRMEVSSGMQKVRRARGAFAADSCAYRRAAEAGRPRSPRPASAAMAEARFADGSHRGEATSSAVRNVNARLMRGEQYRQTETETPLPLQPLVDVMQSAHHSRYLHSLYSHYAALSQSGVALSQGPFELLLRDAGVWDEVQVDQYTVETVLTQILGSGAPPDAALTWPQFVSALAMLVAKKAPSYAPEHNLGVAMEEALMPLLGSILSHCEALAGQLF